MSGYTKIDNGIFESTMWWATDAETFKMFFYMIGKANRDGVYEGTIPGIAGACRVAIEKARECVAYLEAPDPDSRTKEHEGRRIEAIDGGWKILNYWKYRCKDYSSERARDYDRRHPGRRNKKAEQNQHGNDRQRESNDLNSESESESESERGGDPPYPPYPSLSDSEPGPMPSPSGRREAAEVSKAAKSTKTPEPIQECDALVARLNVGHERVMGVPGSVNLMDPRDQKRALAVVKWAKSAGADWLKTAAKAWQQYLLFCHEKGKSPEFKWFAENPAGYYTMNRSKNAI